MSSQSIPQSRSLNLIDESIGNAQLKKGTTWGFLVYRCSYGDDEAWQKMLELLESQVKSTLEVEGRMDLLPRHKLIVMDDASRFDGATSHVIRDHSKEWVADELAKNLNQPEEEKESNHRAVLDSNSENPGPDWGLGTRYNFCLFVDDVCLESLKEMKDPQYPVVKLLWKQWGPRGPEEREYDIHPEYEDGETEEGEEDVGWMYMEVIDYVNFYDRFNGTEYWYDRYSRPPTMIGVSEDKFPGSWRKIKAAET